MRRLVLLLALAGLAVTAGQASAYRHTAFAQKLENALRVPGVSSHRTGALAVDLHTGRVVYAHNEALPLAPASNEKLAVTYAALVRLGPRFRFRTTVYAAHGNLYLFGGGDPTLKVAGLHALALQLRKAGIRSVAGNVLADEHAFDTRRTAPGWKASFYRHESPPLSALVVARGTFHREISPDPAGAAAALFVNQLEKVGIRVRGESAWGRTPAHARRVAQIRSAPLSDVLQFMDRWSDNFTAEMVLKTLGSVLEDRGTTASGAQVVVQTLKAAHVPLRGVRIADGSGLSSRDRFTARALGGILVAGWTNLKVRPYLWRALAVAGRTGTLANRLERYPAHGVVHAKTGTTDIASALSGFAGRRYAFAVVNDGSPVATWQARDAQDRFATVLAAHAIAGRCRATCR